jgi:enoyl-CoA hydratase/carnithine racemase/carbon monoxide dehydrogenase subunit G
VLRPSIPGCESLEKTADDAFAATLISTVGPVKARFSGQLKLSNVDAPRSYMLSGTGSGGAAGFVEARVEVSLDAIAPDVTNLRYVVSATVGGKLAQLGSRLIDAAAHRMADDFFARFVRRIDTGAERATGTESVPDLADLAGGGGTAREREGVRAAHGAEPSVGSLPQGLPDRASAAAEALASGQVKVWISDQIAVVTLNRPDRRNAMTYAMWRGMPGIFAALESNPDVRAVILAGAGADFCAGADISEFELVRDDAAQAAAFEVVVDGCCDAIANITKPTIAVIRGYCLGGGAHLAMCCDFRYAAPDAVFGIPAARLSIVYGIRGTGRLLALVGLPRAKKILFGAQRFTSPEALRIGFVDHVASAASPPTALWWSRLFGTRSAVAGDPMIDARDFARSLVDNAPLSIAGAKTLLNGMSMGHGTLDLARAKTLIAQASDSEDYREGRAAFAAKRAPRFRGR